MEAVSNLNKIERQERLVYDDHRNGVKYISIILTQFDDLFSKLIRIFAQQEYTHISIGVDGYEKAFTVNYHGFSLEKPHKLFRRKKNVRLILEISAMQYEMIVDQLSNFEKRRSTLKYTRLGVLLCALNIPLVIRNRYFCSQFVADVLRNSGFDLQKKSVLYLPQELYKELEANTQRNQTIMY